MSSILYRDARAFLALPKEERIQHMETIAALLRQLHEKNKLVSPAEFGAALGKTSNRFSFAIRDAELVGIAQATLHQTLTGRKVWLDTVVVHEQYRGQGVGYGLLHHLYNQVDASLPTGARVEWVLTNRPERNNSAFYERYGFTNVPTNVFGTQHATFGQRLSNR